MVKKLLAMIGVMVLCMVSAYAATRFDYEDFENYTAHLGSDLNNTFNRTLFFAEAPLWNCWSDPPDCVDSTGNPVAAGAIWEWEVTKLTPSGNQYLTIATLNGNFTSYYLIDLHRYPSQNTTIVPNKNITIQMMMRLVTSDYSRVTLPQLYKYSAGLHINSFVTSVGTSGIIQLGKRANVSQTQFESLRFQYNSSPPYQQNEPRISSCDMSDHRWHQISVIYQFNNLCHYQNYTAYLDGTVCDSYSSTPLSVFFCNTTLPLSAIMYYAAGIFAIDIDNISFYDGIANVSLPASYECNDGLDNDDDGFIDYPTDPSCTSASGATESPFDYTQCNNGLDDDADGYIDLADPRCLNSSISPSEFPSDISIQPNSTCLAEELCLLNDGFPYTDNITMHGWYGSVARLRPLTLLGSNQLYLDNSGAYDFNAAKNITNSNIYNTVQVRLDLSMATKSTWSGDDSSTFYIDLRDTSNRTLAYLKFVLTQLDPLATRCMVYISDGGGEELFATLYPTLNLAGHVKFKLTIDQVAKVYQIAYAVGTTWTEDEIYYSFDTPSAAKLYTFIVRDPNYDSTKFDTYIDDISIIGADTGDGGTFDTVCDVVVLPYYLKESFNGYLAVCDWSSSHNIWFRGVQELSSSTGFYYAQKQFVSPADQSPLGDAVTRYYTVSYDFALTNYTSYGNWELRLYDNTGYNFFVIYNSYDSIMYNANGEGRTLTTPPINTTLPYRIVFDFQADTYNIYYNGTKIVSNANLINQFYNMENVDTVKIASSYTGFKLDNLAIYTSDSTGVPSLGGSNIPLTPSNTTSMCGLFYKQQPTCDSDDDCDTGDCMPNGRCNSFDMTYCDKNGYVRGNKCILASIASCAASNTKDFAFANMVYVLIFIIILIALTYFSIMLRHRGG